MAAPFIKLRLATAADQSILEYWDSQPHVMAASGDDDDWDWEEMLSKNVRWLVLLIAELDSRPIGMVQIIDPREEETHYWGNCKPNLRAIDIWIGEADDLGKGYGTVMMNLALERCFAVPEVTAVLIDPLVTNVKACRFYEKLGFEFLEERLFGADLCRVYQLTRGRWEE